MTDRQLKIRTAVYGGTFNPIHKGHLAVTEGVMTCGMADELWLMVTPRNPFKKNWRLLSDGLRLKMAQEAVEGIDGVTASDFEFSLPKPSYTVNTLRKLSEEYPDREFLLVIGSDNWESFKMWYETEYIQEHYHILIYPRENYPLPEQLPECFTIIDAPMVNVSSTMIRNAVKEGLPIDGLVPECVARTISELGLYL